jgi:hypothetical protein
MELAAVLVFLALAWGWSRTKEDDEDLFNDKNLPV